MPAVLADPSNVDLVLAHGSCTDGWTSLWVVRLVRGAGAEYREVYYHEAPPDVSGRRVAIVDFSYSRPELDAMTTRAKSLIVLDHHETAQRALDGHPLATFDMSRSGARMAFDWVADLLEPADRERADLLTRYVQDRDLWTWALPDSRAISAAMMCLPRTFGAWDQFAERLLTRREDVILEGEAILAVLDFQLQKLAKTAALGTVAGTPAWLVDAPYSHASDLGNLLADRPGPGVAAVWRYDHARQMMTVSLRSSEASGVVVSKIAELFGGGGHARSAGFEVMTGDPRPIRALARAPRRPLSRIDSAILVLIVLSAVGLLARFLWA